MRYLSVCSGIEAATVAWHHLGWTPVGFSEIEPFPSAVLAHHYPNVPNYGDMTKHATWPIRPGSIDILCGGTPCQSFSVAGLRAGLADPRGSLMLTYLEIAQRLRPRWVVWENVPGVLSSGGGRDFGSFLGALGELGYAAAYRVLDAQWCRTHGHPRAVPQRRRRVFVVGRLIERGAGDWIAAAKVLLESESVQRDYSKKRKATEVASADAEGCAGTVSSKWAKGTGGPAGDECYNLTTQLTAGTLGNRGLRSHTELDGHGAYIPVPFTKARRAQSVTDYETWVDGEVNPTLSLFDASDVRTTTIAIQGNLIGRDKGGPHGVGASTDGSMYTMTKADVHGVTQAMTVRRLTPRECERLQGFPDDYTLIPWRGKPAHQCPDGPRYKALGNSMAVNCMEWIGERIAEQGRGNNA